MKEKQAFERVVVSREEALSMFEENKFKTEIIDGLPQDATISLYRCGPMVSCPLMQALSPPCSLCAKKWQAVRSCKECRPLASAEHVLEQKQLSVPTTGLSALLC